MWEPCSNGEVPFGAVEVGHTSDGEKLFMGRCVHDGAQTPGKVNMLITTHLLFLGIFFNLILSNLCAKYGQINFSTPKKTTFILNVKSLTGHPI